MNLASRLARDSGLGALGIILVGIIGALVLACIEIPKWFLGKLKQLAIFLRDYNEHRPDLPPSH